MQAILTEREAEVLRLRLLKNLTLEQAGKQLKVTAERVRQIQNSALRRIERAGLLPPDKAK